MPFSDFQKKIAALSPVKQEFLKILSIVFEPLGQTKMMELLKACKLFNEAGKRIYPPEVKKISVSLKRAGWISADSKAKISCLPDSSEFLMRIAVGEEIFESYRSEIQKLLPYKEYGYRPTSFERCLRDLRIAIYQHKGQNINPILQDISNFYHSEWMRTDFFASIFLPFNPEWFEQFPLPIQGRAIDTILINLTYKLEPIQEIVGYFEKQVTTSTAEDYSFISPHLSTIYLLQGQLDKTISLLKNLSSEHTPAIEGGIMLLKGDYSAALKKFNNGLKGMRKLTGSRQFHFDGLEGLFNVLAIIQVGEKTALKKVIAYAKNTLGGPFLRSFYYLIAVTKYQASLPDYLEYMMTGEPQNSIDWLFWGLATYWMQGSPNQEALASLYQCYHLSQKNDYHWMHLEFTGILSKLEPDEEKRKVYEKEYKKLQKKTKLQSVLDIVPVVEQWERSLQALLQLNSGRSGQANTGIEKTSRLIYLVDFDRQQIQPKEQSRNKSGKWSAGRNVALKRLKTGGVSCMTLQDAQIGQCVKVNSSGGWGYYNKEVYEFNVEKVFKAMVDHPFLFLWDSPSVSVELTEQKAELQVEQKGDFFELKFTHDFTEMGNIIIRETPTRYKLLHITKAISKINRLLDGGKLKIPKKARERVAELVGNLSTLVTIQSSVGQKAKNIKTSKADATTYVHLLPIGDGFKIEFFAKPFKSEPPYFKPGAGRENVLATIKGVSRQTKRNLQLEKKNADATELACPSLQKVPNYNGEWSFDEVEDCLNVMLELMPLQQEKKIILEHPKGEKIRVVGEADFSSLSLNIKKERDWFGISGELKVDNKKVLDFQKLLAQMEDTPMRFIEISDGKFLALTDQFRRKLQEISSLFNKTKNNLQLHPLAIPAMEDFADAIHDLKVDAAWKKQVKRLQEARNIKPKVPSTFKAELRTYQERGFQWLSQLAHWGVGACLADDMGLGKTVQALALILDRAKEGASLVVAPASVARNWLRETQKFTPTLNPLLLGQGDRKEMVKNLKPFDLLICSYGLMHTEEDLLSQHQFTCIVLDEAQAIKNRQTKRSKTAMKLQGDFKVLTTGTPIENHLGEIWNLFNFLNPGLLGSLEKFNNNFAIPIEKYQDKEKRQQLRRLLQPFILRRRKNDVLSELPEKTEITLTVELSPKERAFYEALRQNALSKLAGLEDDGGQKRFQILAELMRLRQAACHPRLVVPDSKIQSSKLELLGEIISELIENGHKALIFSQFVRHLRLVEEWVKSQEISYQYLDGQTSLPKREKFINAFQAGEGDLFLISLKAGGTGLNLTAADYVIHLDPWWNPAVEDQASDRAHRIGQQRPVTIYRLVTEQTIEEKIVQLHAEKRNLADSLLEGTEASGKLSAADLLGLIRDTNL